MRSAPEIATHLGMSRSTTYRYLQSLRSYGLIEDDPSTGGFRLGPRIFELAQLARKGLGLREIALPIMRALSQATDETVLLTRRSGDAVVCLERIESTHPVRISYEVGQILPLHAGAAAKVLLAFMEEKELNRLLQGTFRRFTDRTTTDARSLRRELEEIRLAGYVVTGGELDPGVRGVAAPVLLGDGTLAAGLSVAGPEQRLTELVLPKIIDAVRQSAKLLSERLEAVSG